MNNKMIYLIAGGIAVGKSSVAYNIIRFYNLFDIPYISNDIFREKFFSDENSYRKAQNLARCYSERLLYQCVEEKKSFVWETIMSKQKKFLFLEFCKKNCYKLATFFVGVDTPSVSIERANKRAKEGSHFLGADFIVDRYKKTGDSLTRLNDLSDIMVIINNTCKQELIYYRDSCVTFLSNSTLPEWVKFL